MKFRLTLIALLLFACAAPCFSSETDSAELTLSSKAMRTDYLIDGADWICADTFCYAQAVPDMPAVRSCQRVVIKTGSVTRFIWRGRTLNTEELATCNTRAKV